jgi:aryl-alcohol dehydrogenase-like predicted oxidoreductase
MYFGSETSEEDAFAILDTFVEAGGNLIDTADVANYRDRPGSPALHQAVPTDQRIQAFQSAFPF